MLVVTGSGNDVQKPRTRPRPLLQLSDHLNYFRELDLTCRRNGKED